MLDLPTACSVIFDLPFTQAGIDYSDPVKIKKGKRTRRNTGTDKRYRRNLASNPFRISW